jgi:hypothetical protein
MLVAVMVMVVAMAAAKELCMRLNTNQAHKLYSKVL